MFFQRKFLFPLKKKNKQKLQFVFSKSSMNPLDRRLICLFTLTSLKSNCPNLISVRKSELPWPPQIGSQCYWHINRFACKLLWYMVYFLYGLASKYIYVFICHQLGSNHPAAAFDPIPVTLIREKQNAWSTLGIWSIRQWLITLGHSMNFPYRHK